MLFSSSPIRRRTFSCMRGDLTIRGTDYRPNGEKLPIAIVCHGFMANQQTVRQYARVLAKIGYCAYCFDFCGGSVPPLGRSDGATTDMSVLTEVQDLEAVIRYAQSLPYTSDTLLLMGCSQGGMVSALTAAKHPDAVDRLVLFYPAFCIPDDARAGHMMMAHFDPQNLPEKIHCSLRADAAGALLSRSRHAHGRFPRNHAVHRAGADCPRHGGRHRQAGLCEKGGGSVCERRTALD